jgi:hypothetical protein
MREARWSAMQAALAARGVQLKLDGGPVEHEGTVYEFYTHGHWGKLVAALHPLGDLPLKPRFRHQWPQAPPGIGVWPSVLWFHSNGAVWERGAAGSDLILPPTMNAAIGARHADAGDQAHFYAAQVFLIDDIEAEAPDLNRFLRAASLMADLFRQGKLVQ